MDKLRKVLITLQENEVAPRFDLTTEVLIAQFDKNGAFIDAKTVVLPQASAEDLCHFILSEEVDTVVCGGIEEEFHQYLTWKKVKIIESVMGPHERAMKLFQSNRLTSGAILFDRERVSSD